MKKVILLVNIIAICLVSVFSAAACINSDKPGEQITPSAITLSGMKTEFAFGEEFTSEGLTVTVNYSDGTSKNAKADEYTCDYKNYNSEKAGEYIITVTLKGTTISKQYTVKVAEKEGYPPFGQAAWGEDGVLKILAIGNSFSMDTMEYVWNIADSVGVPYIELGHLYISGCNLKTHLYNIRLNEPNYEYYFNDSGIWEMSADYTIESAVTGNNWDFISLQQASGLSGEKESYSDLLPMISELKKIMPESAQLVWNMTWAYQQDSTHGDFIKYGNDQTVMYNAICKAVQECVKPVEDIKTIIPNGTAVQNVRKTSIGDTLTRDGYHLSYGLGRYIAGLTYFSALTGMNVDNIEFMPSGVTEEQKNTVVTCVKNAILTPYEVTSL